MRKRTFAPQPPPSRRPWDQMATNELQPRRTVEYTEAVNFVTRVRTRFQNDDTVYRSFLTILERYRRDEIPITQVFEQVAEFFCDHPDLLDEFITFLPDTSAAATSQPTTPAGNNNSSS